MSFLGNLTNAAKGEKKYLPDVSERIGDSFQSYIIPRKGWEIHEDYIINKDTGYVNTVALIFNEKGVATDLQSQWGVEFIKDLVKDVTDNEKINQKLQGRSTNLELNVSFVNTVRMMDTEWVKKHQSDSDNFSDRDGDNNRERAKIASQQEDLARIALEIDHGSSYLGVGFKYVISASSLELLNTFLKDLQQRLKLRIDGTIVALPNGNIEKEFRTIFSDPMHEPGMKNMFTSSEFAGFYNIVTEGIEDPYGVYMGEQANDINNTAVLWDMTDFDHYAVLGIDNRFRRLRDNENRFVPQEFKNFSGSDMWVDSLILQLVRENQGRTFTLALDPLNMSETTKAVTSTISLNRGTINPFEMFGSADKELEIYQSNIEKWNIMARQMASFTIQTENAVQKEPLTSTEIDDLDEILEQFYIDHHMWRKNADNNRNDLRVVNVSHDAVPTLDEFVAYIQTQYEKYNGSDGDPLKAQGIAKIYSVFNRMLTNSGGLFNTHTSAMIDSLGTARNTLLDYSQLASRGGNVLLVQLLNSFAAIASQTHEGDVIILHGAQRIENMTRSYISRILTDLYTRHVRIVFSYNNAELMLNDKDFNHLSSADWVLTGHLTPDQVSAYNEALGNQRQMTENVAQGIQSPSDTRYYLRRRQENVLFDANQTL